MTTLPNSEFDDKHYISAVTIKPPFPQGCEVIYLGGGCFWGIEEIFWSLSGVHTTFVGYGGGYVSNPTYKQVCTGKTGHVELVGVVYDPKIVSLVEILSIFWQSHDPTQGDRQGGDIGTQYRSAIYTTTDEQFTSAQHTATAYQKALTAAGEGKITTDIAKLSSFYYAESYHQQYLAKNPQGYRCHSNIGVPFPSEILLDMKLMHNCERS